MIHISQSPVEPDFVQDPYPFYEEMRRRGEFCFWDDYSLPCVVGFASASAIFKNRKFGREIPEEKQNPIPNHLKPFYAVEAHSMLELEAPRHTRLRGLVLRAFTSRRIKELVPEIETLTHALIDAFPAGEFDLLSYFAQKLPVIVICRLLGVPEEMADDLLRWSNAMVTMYQARRSRADEDAAVQATEDFVAFMRSYVEERRSKPADDLITALIAAEADGEKLSTDELITTCILLLNAGHEATVHTIGNGVKTVLEHGAQAACAAPHVSGTIEEILRFDPPLHMFTRWAYEDVEIAGHQFRRGDEVALLLGAANRDPANWDQPAQFDPTRPVKPNLAFGQGVHFCVGAPLARLELQVALPILFERCPDLRLTTPPRYANLYHFHGLERLQVSA